MVRAEAAATGRDPDAIEFTGGGARTVEAAKRYADFGIHRLTVAVRASTIPEMREEVARLGDELVDRTVDVVMSGLMSWRRRNSCRAAGSRLRRFPCKYG